jgi:hypothetical protein
MNLEDLVRATELGWRWLLKPLRPLHFGPLNNRTVLKPHRYGSSAPDPGANTQWQLSFSNLNTLKMTFYLNDVVHPAEDRADRGECCNLSVARRMGLIGSVGEAEMLLKADSVSIVWWIWSSKATKYCKAHESLFQALERRVTRV